MKRCPRLAVRGILALTGAILACSAGFAQPAVAQQPDPPPGSAVDVKAVVDKFVVATDGAGRYLVGIPFGDDVWEPFYWSHDGKQFDALRITGGSSVGTEQFDKVFWEPRVAARWQAAFGRNADGWWVQCRDRKKVLKVVDGEARTKLLANATFITPPWDRRAYALTRDDSGVYWYVDRGVGEKSRNFLVYMGMRGQLKPMPLVNVVSDSEGDIFATKTGTLRLILGKGESTWVKGKRQAKLVVLPIEDNGRLIYTELGVYLGRRLGTPCDDL
ncbi:MAG: hypothetical protein ACOYOB_13935 [Myxococcota bacterium]